MHTRRSKSIDLASYDPEVERTLRKLRGTIKQKRALVYLPPSSPPHLSLEEEEEPQEGMANNQDANKHFMELHAACSGMRPANVDEEQVKLRAFPFTLEAKAKEWLYNLSPGSMNTWNQVKQAFLEQYFPTTKAASIRKDIYYYERFTYLVASCPNHQISDGGAFMDKTPTNAKALLKNIAGNTRQFGGRDELPLKKVNELSANFSNELQLANLTNLVCGVCSMMGHATDMCPSLMDQGFQGQQRQKYDPYSNNYNAGWRDHPHLKWNNQDNGQQSVPNNYNRPPGLFQARLKSLGDLIASLANSTQSHQQKEGAKPRREAQRRLNPFMMEVVKKEVIKLIDVGIIYPISDSKWVSPRVNKVPHVIYYASRTLNDLLCFLTIMVWRLATPNTDQQPLCITYPNAEGGFELKSGMIHYLPKFHGFSTEDANKHLMEFHAEQVKLRAFPFTLEAKAKEWLYNLPSRSMNTWNQVKQAFLEQYFPATKAASIRKDICHLLIQYFYEGLCGTDYVMLDAASGGAFMDKTQTNAKALLKNIVGKTRQFGGKDELPLKKVNEVSANSSIELQLANLTNLVCDVCSMMGHATDMCPSLMDQGGLEQANALGGFQGQQRQKYEPYSNNYNAGWRDHPHLKWNNQDNVQQSVPNNYNRPPGFFQARLHAPFQPQQQAPSKSLEDLIASLANPTQSHQ
ncbi:hypothetical protein D8674_034920 [Pyrus ussuriensis x Pyrus communis]|uniref:Retrotransposon gag domain-containing protein n=1 Tax=Pyrus ussuriensis x Pyrus communis TaxID=2448454 RepID=A0A5N5GPD6_9ROSA|nr:hypothetical protein D8674_034920 [Pyrus ussuriensis x Pyrus communis]